MRAGRLLWAKLIKGFNPKSEKSLSLRTHCQTSGWSLTAQDVFNNVSAPASRRWPPRRAIPSRCTPTRWTRRWRCRRISARASPATPSSSSRKRHDPKVIDPWGGSYFVERLTHDLARKAWEHIEEVEARAAWPRRSRRASRRCASRKPPPDAGPHRRRPADRRRREQVPPRREREHRGPEGRQYRRPQRPDRSAEAAARRTRPRGLRGALLALTRRPKPARITC
jgi:hypothetical protein